MGRPIKHSDPFLWALASENNSKWPVKRRMVSSSLYILLGPTPHEELLEHLLDAQKKKHSSTCCWPRLSGSPVQEEGDGNGSSRRKNCKFNKAMAHCYNCDDYGNFPKECRAKKKCAEDEPSLFWLSKKMMPVCLVSRIPNEELMLAASCVTSFVLKKFVTGGKSSMFFSKLRPRVRGYVSYCARCSHKIRVWWKSCVSYIQSIVYFCCLLGPRIQILKLVTSPENTVM